VRSVQVVAGLIGVLVGCCLMRVCVMRYGGSVKWGRTEQKIGKMGEERDDKVA